DRFSTSYSINAYNFESGNSIPIFRNDNNPFSEPSIRYSGNLNNEFVEISSDILTRIAYSKSYADSILESGTVLMLQ
ncbi:hypothetical protein, partial [Propionibacterium freudenreichii]|uniref:hypothetical protein n=1 Tax=Propionibacterium freudenreichii TaxID=1744 RepID=UPI003853CA62